MIEVIFSIIGMISGLIAIYSFITGVTSIRQLKRTPEKMKGYAPSGTGHPKKHPFSWIPIFVTSAFVTLAMGLAGSDTGGIMFVLLLISSLSIILYSTNLHRFISWPSFSVVNVILLAGLGLVFGEIARGEEGIGLIMGVILGIGVGVITLISRRSAPAVHTESTISDERYHTPSIRSTDSIEEEKQVLRVAERLDGEIKVTDVSLQTTLSLDESRDILESLEKRGYCKKLTSESGATVYRFNDFHR